MQKKLIALALAGLAAAPAFAQSNVTIYGRVDFGFENRGGSDGAAQFNGRKNEFASGMQSGSRIGFKGDEALGNGLKLIWQLESGIRNDEHNMGAGNAGIWSSTLRNAYIGLTGNWGTVVGGRLDGVRYGIFNKYDPFAGGGMGNFTQMTYQVDRADNAIAYVSPKWNGFGFVAAYTSSINQAETNGVAGGVKANTGDGELKTIMATYDNGPLSLTADYERVDIKHMGDTHAYVITLGGSYDFKFVKVSALWDKIKQDNTGVGTVLDDRAWFIGASVPYGNFLFKANYGRVTDHVTPDADSSKFGLGVNYYLSKRTNVYFDYGRINNDTNGIRAISPGANAMSTNTGVAGGTYGVSGYNIGIAHNF